LKGFISRVDWEILKEKKENTRKRGKGKGKVEDY